MPLYDYGCSTCETENEVQHPISEIGKIEVFCSDCGAKMKKLLSAPMLMGFDDVGRSVNKKERDKKSNKASTKKVKKEAKKATSAK